MNYTDLPFMKVPRNEVFISVEHLDDVMREDEHYENYLQMKEIWKFYYYPVIFSVMLTVGMVGNLLVLVILLRHPEMRTLPNKIVMHIASGDLMVLLCGTVVYYCNFYGAIPYNTVGCYITLVTELVAGTISQYAMVLLSFSRYLAMTAAPDSFAKRLLQGLDRVPVLEAAVWFLATMASLTDIIHIRQEKRRCYIESTVWVQILSLCTMCILPLVLIGTFSVATARFLRRSIRGMPGEESPGMETERRARGRSAKILISLTLVFTLSYVPYTVVNLLMNFKVTKYMILLGYISRLLLPLNATLNPWALCCASTSFRKYFKYYLLCCQSKQIK